MKPHGKDNTSRRRKASVVERNDEHEPLAKGQVQEAATARVFVRVTSVRKRLLDEDNLCEKFHVDCCRYAGLLLSDAPGKTSIKTTQRQAGKGEKEHIIIEITDIE